MATRNLTREITVEAYPCSDVYEGPRDALISAGLADPTKFPGDPGNRKTSQRYQVGGRVICIQRSRKGIYSVTISCTDEERSARLEDLKAQEQREHAHRALAALPQSPGAYIAIADRVISNSLALAMDFLEESGAGYHLSPDSMEDVRHAMQELIETVRESSVEIDTSARRTKVTEIRTTIARNDRSFAQFMGKVLPE